MTMNTNTETTSLGDDVMKAVGGLDAATAALKAQCGSGGGVTEDDAVSILTIIGRAILNIFGK
jgi:hypothetical protein